MASICDGTVKRGTENCGALSLWLIRLAGDERGGFHAACDRHVAQVGRTLLEGERGALDVRSIQTDER